MRPRWQHQLLVREILTAVAYLLSISGHMHAMSITDGGGGGIHYYQVQGQQWIQRNQPRTQHYSLGHESAQSAWQGI